MSIMTEINWNLLICIIIFKRNLLPKQGAHWVLKLGVQWGTIAVFSLTVPLHIESLYNFGGTGPILGVKKPLQRVNGHAAKGSNFTLKFC